MSEASKISHVVRPLSDNVQPQQTKQTWHKPTVTFVPLHVTAEQVGSGPDGDTFQEPPA